MNFSEPDQRDVKTLVDQILIRQRMLILTTDFPYVSLLFFNLQFLHPQLIVLIRVFHFKQLLQHIVLDLLRDDHYLFFNLLLCKPIFSHDLCTTHVIQIWPFHRTCWLALLELCRLVALTEEHLLQHLLLVLRKDRLLNHSSYLADSRLVACICGVVVAVRVLVNLSSKGFEEVLLVGLTVLALRAETDDANLLVKVAQSRASRHLGQFLHLLLLQLIVALVTFSLGLASNVLGFGFRNVCLGLVCGRGKSLVNSWHACGFVQFVLMLLKLACYSISDLNLFLEPCWFLSQNLRLGMMNSILASQTSWATYSIRHDRCSFSLPYVIKNPILESFLLHLFKLDSLLVWFKLLDLERLFKKVFLRIVLACRVPCVWNRIAC